jgi:hypothetical protein
MPAPRVTAKTKLFELEIVLEEVQPPVRRRVQVPGEVNLAVLHEVVQSAMGWTNSHLHEFDIGGRRYGVPDPDDNLFRTDRRADQRTDQPARRAGLRNT